MKTTGTQKTAGGTMKTGGPAKEPKKGGETFNYGSDWYENTRQQGTKRTIREEIEYKKQANLIANNGQERKDLYTDNWDGGEYKGSSINILTVLIALSIGVPIAGIIFAFKTYGILWG
ncbi:MAG: hypothetical protein WDW38_006029 [Sanguina aurantia]